MVSDEELRAGLLDTGNVKLLCTEGSSDKVYEIKLVPKADGALVEVVYGRRNSTMRVETKTPGGPVQLDAALKIAVSLLKSKIKGGYRPEAGARGTLSTAVSRAIAAVDTGLRPHLLTPLEESEARRLLYSDDFYAQEKMDGERRIITVDSALNVIAANRRGMVVTLPEGMTKELLWFDRRLTLDAEIVGDELWVFDLLSLDDIDLRSCPFERRIELLSGLGIEGHFILVCPTARTSASKTALLESVEYNGGEGLVLKSRRSEYTEGRNHDQFKWKFWRSLTAVVTGVNDGKRSISLGLVASSGNLEAVGNVTVPVDLEVPHPGAKVEIRYLYGYKGGSLFQPVLLGTRTDVDLSDCGLQQVFYKAAATMA